MMPFRFDDRVAIFFVVREKFDELFATQQMLGVVARDRFDSVIERLFLNSIRERDRFEVEPTQDIEFFFSMNQIVPKLDERILVFLRKQLRPPDRLVQFLSGSNQVRCSRNIILGED